MFFIQGMKVFHPINVVSGSIVLLSLFSYSGKFMVTAAFHLVYIITGELFSTKMRSLMLGEASVCARIGSISAPYINTFLVR